MGTFIIARGTPDHLKKPASYMYSLFLLSRNDAIFKVADKVFDI